ncbi:YihY/virulence factor BrkB family protein [Anaerolineales bacterium HSG25]|nr:YihY/virulence factor BrkB family protein [Anaerolineales bacterium HSG25]
MPLGFQTSIRSIYRYINRLTWGVFGILVDTIQHCIELQVVHGAAAIAYYALFSLLPIALFSIAFASLVLQNKEIQDTVLGYAEYFIPTSSALVQGNIDQLLEYRNTVGLVGTVGLVWAATSVFTVLIQVINAAWHTAPPRNFIKERLMGLMIISALAILLTIALVMTTVITVISNEDTLFGGTVNNLVRLPIFNVVTSGIILFGAFLLLYKWIPNTPVRWSEAAWGALVATLGWEIAKEIFSFYLTRTLSRYQLIYGSLGTVIAFMLWTYISSLIILVGANLSAAITRYNQNRVKKSTVIDTLSHAETVFSREEAAKIIHTAFTITTIVAEADTQATGTSIIKFIATVKDMILAPYTIQHTFQEFTDQNLVHDIMGDAELQKEMLQYLDIDTYIEIPWQNRFEEVTQIIEAKLSSEKANTLKRLLLDIGEQIARQSGGELFGLRGEISRYETNCIAEIAYQLNASHLLRNEG